ncbi:MAG: LLM class flavin-dependent oxidoreductase [Pseudomonadales bacterium]|jgi:alkanesulfonate monooxygenase SsuD/methylene tetrahydromethanopterin reductase-like flavin-dependent oxidoreductase (luciferase family)|nr:LLM class flavin-dependent oxidoreductase [Pseudomonadales bacterium]MDP6471901.1 LLM class flavin-dependent oxidoreductase [Pseudomonadales bacterium]MDP6826829.1 LLM class flavin-dependent oxidoreductase [Pseudomonadales bacterium]MDP6970893.1 LLM class flavin-dependent oxidoreductase [Pseudomonadales bacterium]|tara:strand:+ start:425 stop:1336 length:912 start_codon:yes stop_codon:yes gene_type:complete
MDVLVGTLASPALLNSPFDQRARTVSHIVEAGIDHVFIADHVSFHVGTGMDGLINAATLTALHPDLKVCVGVYLLALRHPIVTARQLSTLAESSAGQLMLGIGVGGEDRNEIAMCGIDPATRGRRTDECLYIVRELLTGEPLDFEGEFFQFERAWIKPAPKLPIPILVGGRADASLRRAARHGDGWLGIWSTPERYRRSVDEVNRMAQAHGRTTEAHSIQVWVGVDNDRAHARARLAKGMREFYQIPYERFEKFSPWGSVDEVADALLAYRDAGCRVFNIMPVAENETIGIEAVARIAQVLRG